jgi:hypothetical protein
LGECHGEAADASLHGAIAAEKFAHGGACAGTHVALHDRIRSGRLGRRLPHGRIRMHVVSADAQVE